MIPEEAILTEQTTKWANNPIASTCDPQANSDKPRYHFCPRVTISFPFLEVRLPLALCP